MVMLQGSPVTAPVTEAPGDTQLLAAASQVKLPAASSCGLSDSDVHRILAHRRAYIKQQRAFDRACVGNEHAAFDPTQVLPSMTLLWVILSQTCLRNINGTVKLKMNPLPAKRMQTFMTCKWCHLTMQVYAVMTCIECYMSDAGAFVLAIPCFQSVYIWCL